MTFLDDYLPIDRNPFVVQQPNETFSRFRQHRQLDVHLNEPINIGEPAEAEFSQCLIVIFLIFE